jgi:hypothetical protein
MVTTKYAFKQWLHKHYPDIDATPIYGLNAYIISQPLSEVDMWRYNVQQMENGKYVVFVGATVEESVRKLQELKAGMPQKEQKLPTSFGSFEAFCSRRNITWTNRVYMNNKTPEECFLVPYPENTERRSWYLYELNKDALDDVIKDGVPTHVDGDHIYVLVKTYTTKYKSKKQRFVEHFNLMQPIYEQIIIALTKGEDDKAANLASHYGSLLFDKIGSVDAVLMRKAYHEGNIQMFLRNPESYTPLLETEGEDEVF